MGRSRGSSLEERDVVVVGAGIAGCMTAATIAIKSKSKVDVLLLDRNARSEVGKKTTLGWVCGDAVGEHHIKFLNEHLGVTYGKPEMENRVTAVYVYSPDMKVRVPFEGPGYVLDRPKFGRRLLEDALKAGVEFRGGVQALDLVEDSGRIVGLKGQTVGENVNKPFEIRSKLVIDTSGMSTKLRRNLPIPSHIEKEIDKDDIEPTARLNAKLRDGVEVEPFHCDIYLDQEKAPGGYLWLYNLDFVKHYGSKTAGLEAFRMYLQTLNNQEINYGMRHFLSGKEATEISLGEMPHLSPFEKIVKLFLGLGSYKAFRGLVYTMKQMETLNNLYQNYPKDPSQFEAWKHQVDSTLAETRTRFS